MTSALRIFTHPDFGRIRAQYINGEHWFVANDVAAALGYVKAEKAVKDHVSDGDDILLAETKDSLGRTQKAVHINEAGLYALIFGSRLKSALSFKRWVFKSVLPSITATGTYSAAGDTMAPDFIKERMDIITAHERSGAINRDYANAAKMALLGLPGVKPDYSQHVYIPTKHYPRQIVSPTKPRPIMPSTTSCRGHKENLPRGVFLTSKEFAEQILFQEQERQFWYYLWERGFFEWDREKTNTCNFAYLRDDGWWMFDVRKTAFALQCWTDWITLKEERQREENED